jgi:hypothetical protein
VVRPLQGRSFTDSARILRDGGWQVVPVTASDDLPELWRVAGHHGFDETPAAPSPHPAAAADGANTTEIEVG